MGRFHFVFISISPRKGRTILGIDEVSEMLMNGEILSVFTSISPRMVKMISGFNEAGKIQMKSKRKI